MVNDACCFPKDSGSHPSKEVLAGVESGKDRAFGSQMVPALHVGQEQGQLLQALS